MRRRLLCLFTLAFILLSPRAMADLPQIPSRYTFSMGHERLQSAIDGGRAVNWSSRIEPTAVLSADGASLSILQTLLGAIELSGTLQCFKDGGWFEAALTSGGHEVASLGQIKQNGRIGLNLGGDWISVPQGEEAQAAAMLMLDGTGASLMSLDYSGFKGGGVPVLSTLCRLGEDLWSLASPYCTDNLRMSAPSGYTSHATTYTVDTAAFRSILREWADDLNADDFELGLSGTDFTFGIDEGMFDALIAKTRAFAETVELSKPIVINMAFGEGDVLRSAKGSGTLQEGNKKTKISLNYTCSLSSTRITHKLDIDFQPQNGDTLSLNATWLTSSNNKKSGAQDLTLSASGNYDGQPYRIKIQSEMVNKYALTDDGWLSEEIRGTTALSIKYANKLILDANVKRTGITRSGTGKSDITTNDQYDMTLKNEEGTLFQGVVSLDLAAQTSVDTPDLAAVRVEDMDFAAIETLRASLSETTAQAKENLIEALPPAAMEALLGAY